ncbi:ABC transporter substrate-binding protein [Microbacterium rhizosphaerae]|uniref:ABC transporter substrate-binding protein n=1 Tax=Microbacterium rhizosphaerae TaxID=1678237 RepID=A0ABZ0SQG9_9MICO|nr:ABC transporter substrate-binding protein [Microbacterium rhizosphaerae]WPR89536.1 ABC transporter substrate-binding protein [Microbacterium rhizosphaerae]
MKKGIIAGLALLGVVALAATGCSGAADASNKGGSGSNGKVITVGFAQTGSESGWRSANTESMKDAFSAKNGFKLIFNAADNKPENQIAAVRSFINQGVDAIVIAPVVTTGWDDVLKEAKDADIPVILEDRTIDGSSDLYKAWIGDDFKKEGETAGAWAKTNLGDKATNMVVLEGTTGSAPAIDRSTGFSSAISGTQIKTLDSQTGNFTRADGKTVMEGFLQKYGKDINLLFAQNDDMGLGALDAIKAAGLTPGKDIQIVTIDGTHDGLQALADGQFNYVVECNPLLGPTVAKTVKDVLAGKAVEKKQTATDQAFDQEQAKQALPTRKY